MLKVLSNKIKTQLCLKEIPKILANLKENIATFEFGNF